MKPLTLRMTAFGPFAKQEYIDFTALGENPLFLINGPTGAGKTTILDAICFVLYGQTTGAEREGRQMRCDFAADDLLSEVEFTFELKGKRYRVHRVPEQLKPRKKGGEGEVLQKPTATMHEVDGDTEKLLANKVTDATNTIVELTGLDVNQFRQVMVLPQGKFRELLMADSKSREDIFSQLFQTHIYKKIEDQLSNKAKQVRITVAKLRDNQQGILQSVEKDTNEALDAAITQQKIDVTEKNTQHQAAKAAYLAVSKNLQAMQAMEQQFLQLEQQLAKQKQLESKAAEIQQLKEQLTNAEAADRLQPIYQQQQQAAQEHQQATQEQQQAQTRFAQQEQALADVEAKVKTLPELEEQLAQTQKTQSELSAYQERSVQLESVRKTFTQHQQQFTQQQSELEQQQLVSAKLLEQRTQLETQKLGLAEEKSNEAALKTQLLDLQTQQQIAQDRDALQTQFQQKQQQLTRLGNEGKALKEQLNSAETHQNQLELRWHNAQAAILASKLQQGEACPVCGGTDHPQPAHLNEQAVPSDQERENAQRQLEQLRTDYLKAREDYSALQADMKKDQEQYAALANKVTESVDALQKQIVAVNTELKAWEKQQAELAKIERQLQKINADEKQQTAVIEQLKTALAESQANLEASKALVNKAEQELPEAYREPSVLQNAIAKNQNEQQQLQNSLKQIREQQITVNKQFESAKAALAASEKQAQQAQAKFEKADAHWQEALAKSVFSTQADYAKWYKSAEQQQQFAQTIESFEQERQQIKGAIAQQQEALKDTQRPQLNELTQQLDTQKQLAEQHERAWQTADAALQQLNNAQQKIQEISDKKQAEEEHYKIIGTLADVANGQTGKKISLQRFVLGVLLDDVLIAASERLTRMSKGRYQLLRKEERAKGNKASGLELEVADGYTGKTRPVATLSGGESFMASLSLALGLSEVVQAYAGGVHLDTLFVDEGFGSLDADSLDIAIRTLIDLRETGRMVGIISHVSELKEQITQRIDLVNDREGSHVSVVS